MRSSLLAFLLTVFLAVDIACAAPPAASERVKVTVPATMRAGAFSTDRYLTVPRDFAVAVYARVSGARFLAVAPNGDLLVSVPGAGKIMMLRAQAVGDPQVFTFASGLNNPHDMVFHEIDGSMWLYISESNQISRYFYRQGDTAASTKQVLVSNLPDNSTPELRGAYAHALKNIALDRQHKLYVSIGSSCNVCTSDTQSNPVRAAIYQYNADGSGGRLFARGLRNAEGLAFPPGSDQLWVIVNNRDNLPTQAGQVTASYVDNHPPDEFTRVRDGGNYGWPFCNPTPDTDAGLTRMPFERDMDTNRTGAVDCSQMDRIDRGIQAHSAPLGLLFLGGTAFAAPYRQGVLAALHGSWNRTKPTGYKLAYFPFHAGTLGAQRDFITGWLDETSGQYWGRPVDAAVDAQGNLFVSDDDSGTVYKLAYTGAGAVKGEPRPHQQHP